MAKARNTTAATTVAKKEVKCEILSSMSMKEFAKDFDIIKASPVRTNSNGYPFITFLSSNKNPDGTNQAENIYFSKRAAALVKLDDEPTVCKAHGMIVLELQYEGEVDKDGNPASRLKLSLEGDGGEYVDIKDLF